VCLLIDRVEKKVVQKLELDYRIEFSKTIHIFDDKESILLNTGSQLSLINFVNKKMIMSHQDLKYYGENPNVMFSSVAFQKKIYIRTQNGIMYEFTEKLEKLGQYDLKGTDWNCDGKYLHFAKRNKFGNILHKYVEIRKFNPEDLQKPRAFMNLQKYDCSSRGRVQVYVLRYDHILLIDQVNDCMMFTIYNNQMHFCVKEFRINAGKKDYRIKYDRKQLLIYPKENYKGQSYFIDFGFLLRKFTKYN